MVQRFQVLITILSLFAALVLNLPVQAAEKKTKENLVVLDLKAKIGVDKRLAKAMSGIVREKLHSYEEFQVMSQDDIPAIANREQFKQATGCDDEGNQCLADFGRKIGARFMVVGYITKLGSTYIVSLRMLDTQHKNSVIINRVRESCRCNDQGLLGIAEDLAGKLVGKKIGSTKKSGDRAPRKESPLPEKAKEEEQEKQDAIKRQNALTKKEVATIKVGDLLIKFFPATISLGDSHLNLQLTIENHSSNDVKFVFFCPQLKDAAGDQKPLDESSGIATNDNCQQEKNIIKNILNGSAEDITVIPVDGKVSGNFVFNYKNYKSIPKQNIDSALSFQGNALLLFTSGTYMTSMVSATSIPLYRIAP